MSNQVEFVNTIDARARCVLEGESKPKYSVPLSFDSIANNVAQVQNYSTSQIQYQFTINKDQLLAPNLVEEIQFNVALTINNASANVYNLGNIVFPRAFPIESISQQCIMTLNNTPIGNLNPSECMTPLMSFNDPDLDNTQLNSFASELDPYYGTYVLNENAIKSPFAPYGLSSYGYTSRFYDIDVGTYDGSDLAAGATAVKNFTFTVRSGLMTGLTPLTTGDYTGFIGLSNNVIVTRNFLANLNSRLISLLPTGVNNVTVTNVAVTIPTQPRLYYQLMQLPQTILQKVPRKTYYKYINYTNLNQQTTCNIGAAGNSSTQFVTNAITLGSNPRAIYVWGSTELAANRANTKSDAPGFWFNNLQLSYGSKNGIFNDMSEWQLYDEFCRRQGFRYSFNECKGVALINTTANVGKQSTFGQVLRIDGSLLPLNSDESVGSACSKQLQLKGLVSCVNPAFTGNVIINFLVIQDGVVCIDADKQSCEILTGLIDTEQIRLLRNEPLVVEPRDHVLGGVFDPVKHLKSFLHHVSPVAHTAKRLIKKVIHGSAMKKSHKKHHSRRGAGLDESEDESEYSEDEMYGGEIVSKIDMLKRLNKY